VKQHL